MPQVGDEAPIQETLFGEPEVDVGPLYVPTENYRVLSVSQQMRYPPDGRVIPDIEVDFVVPDLPGRHIRLIDNYAFTHANVLNYMEERAYEFIDVSAKTRAGLESLLETLLLTAEIGELKANPEGPARGSILEAYLDENNVRGVLLAGSVQPRGEVTSYHFEVRELTGGPPVRSGASGSLGATFGRLPVTDQLEGFANKAYNAFLLASNALGADESYPVAFTFPIRSTA